MLRTTQRSTATGTSSDGQVGRSHLVTRATAPTDQQLVRWFQNEDRSIRQIAEAAGLSRVAVAQRLRNAGILIAPRGAGRPRPRRRRPDPPGLTAALRELYVRQRLPSPVVAEKLGLPERLVRQRLRDLGIPRRTRGGVNREDRHRLPMAPVQQLYVDAELPADEVGRRLGCTRREVLYSAHEFNLPVRPGGDRIDGVQGLRVMAALYRDVEVRRVLCKYRVPMVPIGGPLHVRFPAPVALSAELLRELYLDCGLATFHIEVLTGHPLATIRRQLVRHGIPLRSAGGLSPFIRRVRRLEQAPKRQRSRTTR